MHQQERDQQHFIIIGTLVQYCPAPVPITAGVIQQLEVVQTKLGKSILVVPYSSENAIVCTNLGWKPIRM